MANELQGCSRTQAVWPPSLRLNPHTPLAPYFLTRHRQTGESSYSCEAICCMLAPRGGHGSRQASPMTLPGIWIWHSSLYLKKAFSNYPRKGGKEKYGAVSLVEEREDED